MPTSVEQDEVSFDQIVLIEFFNLGIVTLILNLSGLSDLEFSGFEPGSYKVFGKTLVVTIFLSTIISNLLDLRSFLQIVLNRLKDREYNYRLMKDSDSDQPHTQKTD